MQEVGLHASEESHDPERKADIISTVRPDVDDANPRLLEISPEGSAAFDVFPQAGHDHIDPVAFKIAAQSQ
jgi:hypothetical protein